MITRYHAKGQIWLWTLLRWPCTNALQQKGLVMAEQWKMEIWYCLYIRFTYVLKVLVMAERWKMEILYYLYMRFTYMLKALVMAERWKTKILYQCYRNFTYMINFVCKDEQGNTKILCTMYCALFGYYHCVRMCLVTITVLLCVWLLSRNKKSMLFLDKSKS